MTKDLSRPVYVIGAGFSAELGYPTLSALLSKLYKRLDSGSQQLLVRVIRFHYPQFDVSVPPERWPNIEQLLTRFAINIEFFEVVRRAEGGFKKADLIALQDELLHQLYIWFDEINKGIQTESHEWLVTFIEKIKTQVNSSIISFNWDLVLDKLLFDSISQKAYTRKLLKPHGSLNWFLSDDIAKVSDSKKEWLYKNESDLGGQSEHQSVQIFLPSRKIVTTSGRKYIPWIVPPTFLKKFDHLFLQQTWARCTSSLSKASSIYFLGYSLPEADIHAQYVLHCGYHNHSDGYPGKSRRLKPKPSLPPTFIVNPSLPHAQHITNTLGRNCQWFRGGVSEWMKAESGGTSINYFELLPLRD